MDKVHVYLWLHTASIKSTVGNEIRLYPSPFHVSTGSRLTLDGAFRNDYVAGCSTALCSATGENESGGYVTVPCRIGWISSDVTRLVTTEHLRNKCSLSVWGFVIVVDCYWKLVETVSLNKLLTALVNWRWIYIIFILIKYIKLAPNINIKTQ